MSGAFESVLKPGWRPWLATGFVGLVILIDLVIVAVVCVYMVTADRAWFDWLLAAVLVVVLLVAAVRGTRTLVQGVRSLLRPRRLVMLRVDRQRIHIAGSLDGYVEVSWDDIAAVVFSRVDGRRRGGLGYVQFVPANPASLTLPAATGAIAWKVRNLGLDPTMAALAWPAIPGSTPGFREALVAIPRIAPGHVRIVDSTVRPGAGVDLKQT